MKTQKYNPQIAVKTISLVFVLTLTYLFTLKAQELPSQPALESFTACITAPDNTLAGTNKEENELNNELLAELKSMMASGSYWTMEDESSQKENLTELLANWMKKGLYWEDTQEPSFEPEKGTFADNEDNE
jgi:hypothetical protein